MTTAVVDLSTNKFLITACTSELLKSCKHLPENLRPSDLFLSKEENKFIYIPVLITLVLSNYISMKIDE